MFMAWISAATAPDAPQNAKSAETSTPIVSPPSSCMAITTIWSATRLNASGASSRNVSSCAPSEMVSVKMPHTMRAAAMAGKIERKA